MSYNPALLTREQHEADIAQMAKVIAEAIERGICDEGELAVCPHHGCEMRIYRSLVYEPEEVS